MSETGIEINFRQSMESARVLEKLANSLTQIAEGELLEALTEIERNWEGVAAVEFLRKGMLLSLRMRGSATALAAAAQTVEWSAEKIYRAEQLAATLASVRWGRY